MAAVVAAPACENDMNATNVGPTNPLLDGACDDDDNELTAEQKKIIEDRLKALQARFQAFEEKTTQQKIDELIMANEAYGLTQEEAEMVLRVCNNNEFEASDRLTEEEDGSTFLNAIRSMVGQEKRASRLTGRKRQAEEEQLARRTKILRRRRDQVIKNDQDFRSSTIKIAVGQTQPNCHPSCHARWHCMASLAIAVARCDGC